MLGYWQAKQRLGNPAVAWEELVEPSIQLCEQGITVSGHAARSIQSSAAAIRADPGLRQLLVRNSTGELLVEGDVYRNPALAATLKAIAARGAAELYTGATGRALVMDMAAGGGLLTEADLAEYRVRWEEPVKAALPGDGLTLYSAPPPGSGAILASILGTVAGYCPSPRSRRDPLAWHRFIESCKFAYARRTLLGDWAHGDSPELGRQVAQLVSNLTSPDWWRETRDKIRDDKTEEGAAYYGAQFYNVADAGTTHISVLSPAGQSAAGSVSLPPPGDAVAVTSTVNSYYGSKFRSPATGLIMNNQVPLSTLQSPPVSSRWTTSPIPDWSMCTECPRQRTTWWVQQGPLKMIISF